MVIARKPFVENGYLTLRFPNKVKVNIHEHWTRVTRFNPLWVSDITQYFFLSLREGASSKSCNLLETFGPNNSEGVSTVYKSLVRPILEYGCQVWNPYLVKHIKSIESIQTRATRVICGSEKEYQERLRVLKWPSLVSYEGSFICLVQMYKIIFGHCDIDPHMLFDFNV